MIRVVRVNGSVVIITNGTPEKRLKDLNQVSNEINQKVDIKYQ